MDCRVTLNTSETFLKLLTDSYHSGQKIYLLTDDNGLTRLEGIISSIRNENSETIIELQDEKTIPLKIIVAVNGVFLQEYGEC